MKSEVKSANKDRQTLIISKYKQYLRLEKSLSANTYEIKLMQPWVKQEIDVRDHAHQMATEYCQSRNTGMQPLQATTQRAKSPEVGPEVTYVFRCVGLLDAPKREYHRLGFYTDEESKEEATKRYRDEFGF